MSKGNSEEEIEHFVYARKHNRLVAIAKNKNLATHTRLSALLDCLTHMNDKNEADKKRKSKS